MSQNELSENFADNYSHESAASRGLTFDLCLSHFKALSAMGGRLVAWHPSTECFFLGGNPTW